MNYSPSASPTSCCLLRMSAAAPVNSASNDDSTGSITFADSAGYSVPNSTWTHYYTFQCCRVHYYTVDWSPCCQISCRHLVENPYYCYWPNSYCRNCNSGDWTFQIAQARAESCVAGIFGCLSTMWLAALVICHRASKLWIVLSPVLRAVAGVVVVGSRQVD